MSGDAQDGSGVTAAPTRVQDHRWFVLGTVAIAQLMVVLDATIVNIALPSAQADLGFSDGQRQWVVTAYALAFGSLLLLGGRLGDLFGRKRAFITGLIGFAGASALGGAANSFALLVAARALQGVFGALLAPAALSTLTVTFSDPKQRGKAFGVFGAVAGGGGAVGLVLGGILTEYLSWRWCLYVNLFFAAFAIAGALIFIKDLGHPSKPKLDIPGTLLASSGLFLIVYGFSHAESASWGSPLTVACLVGGVLLLVLFFLVQQRVAHPLLPLRVIQDRNRGGAYLAVGLSGVAIFGVFLFLTFYLQDIQGYSPVLSGLSFAPLPACIVSTSTLSNIKLLPIVGPRRLIVVGMAFGCAAMLLFSRLTVNSSYWPHILIPLMLLGFGFGFIFSTSINTATQGVRPTDAGVASAMVNTMQQVSGSVGTALLSTIALNSAARYVQGRPPSADLANLAAVHGYDVAYLFSAVIFVIAAIVCGSLIRPFRAAEPAAEVIPEPVGTS